jgi:ribosomal protein L7/L12
MKIHITKSELLAILTEHFKQKVDDITITKDVFLLHKSVIDKMVAAGVKFYQNTVSGEDKILAIRTLRGIHPYSLYDAKCAVEQWSKWINIVKRNGKFPSYDNGKFV